jgi:RES domain-containing protein
MDLWRISKHKDLSGEGGRLFPGRWNTAGHPVVYLADSPAAAMLEVLVHLELEAEERAPVGYTLLHILAPDAVLADELLPPEHWQTSIPHTQRIGNDWLESKSAALAKVPSALAPSTFNYLLNPLHRDARRLRIVSAAEGRFDLRLLRRSV